jgi:methylase of polypeptide subunit release factors
MPVHCDSKQGESECPIIGKFNCILCNPPFVAVPFANILQTPALYSAGGGGYDGMQLLRQILKECFNVLHDGMYWQIYTHGDGVTKC